MIPGDISSAAFWMIAASIVPESEIVIKNVGLNPTRTGILNVMDEMGCNYKILDKSTIAGAVSYTHLTLPTNREV